RGQALARGLAAGQGQGVLVGGHAPARETRRSLADAVSRTRAKRRRRAGEDRRRAPSEAPTRPPATAAAAQGASARVWAPPRASAPRRPGREFTQMKAALTPAVRLASAQPFKIMTGERKMPPPTPTSPESSPTPPPTASAWPWG